MDLVCCLLQGAIPQCGEAACLTMNCQTAELVQDCALADKKYMVAFPGLLTRSDCR